MTAATSSELEQPLRPGQVFGPLTVVGPAVPEFRGKGHRYVRVECWSCRELRDVRVREIRQGGGRHCRTCSQHRRFSRRFSDLAQNSFSVEAMWINEGTVSTARREPGL